MKGKFTKIMAALALLVFLMPNLAAWGQTRAEVTWTASEQGYENAADVSEITIDENISGLFAAGTNTSNSPKYYTTGSGVRMYNNNTLTITPDEGYTITSIVFTYSGNNYVAKFEVSTGSYSESQSTGTWTGTSSQAIVFTAKATCRMQSITVTYTSGTVNPTYTVTYNANGGSGEMIDENSPYEANETVTLLENAFTAPEGYLWDSWQVKDAEDNDITVTNGTFTMPASNVTVTAQWVADPNATQYEWVLTNLADLTSDDIFVIVGTTSGTSYSMSNDNGTNNPPTAAEVTIASERITSTVSENIKWNISGNATDGYTFYPNGSTTTWLYCTAANNGVRVGTNDNKTFVIDATSGYLKHSGTSRYVGIYNSQDWRCYTSYSTANIADQSFAFYKRQVVSTDPYIIASNVELAYDATEGSITYELHNATGDITATTDAEWITSLTPDAATSTVAIVCEANPSIDPREATVVLAYGEATKEVTVSQAFNPNLALTTMDQIFARATEMGSTATEVSITFDGWVVSGVTSNNAYVTDGTKGFIIYNSDHGFVVGNVLSGTVTCNVQLFRGSAELTSITSTTEGLTVETGGTVSVADIAMADLSGINTGALVSYENLLCSTNTAGTSYYLTDGTTTIQAYATLFSSMANYLEAQHTYNITGVYCQYNTTKEVLPRSANDIEEVASTYTLDITGYGENVGGYYLIASPVLAVTPTAENGFLTSEYDLYYFDQTGDSEGKEWINYEAGAFNLTSGKGYLYASSSDTQLTFTGTPYNGNGVVALDYDAEASLAGWNLIGNPYDEAATCTKAFYRLNSDGSGVNAETESGAISAMEGIFVVAEATGETVTFTKGSNAKANAQVIMNLAQNRSTAAIDRAIVRFDEGQQLPKFQLFENSTKLYIAQGNKDYAIVRSANQGEMPVSFKAAENGTYTLSVEAENVEMDYLHLIDNLTGMDVDLLQTPSYTFEASTRDYESRFRLVFSASQVPEPVEGPSAFAFFNGSEWQISNTGEATLQVLDMTGRLLSSERIDGTAEVSLNQAAGVYVMRLINGNGVKVQKVVVR